MNAIISGFIDDELTLQEKIRLVEQIGRDSDFSAETLQLLDLEKHLRSEIFDRAPVFRHQPDRSWKHFMAPLFRPAAIATAAVAAALIFMLLYPFPQPTLRHPKRFVIYQPLASQVEITGSFTDWRRLPLQKIGDSGYWDITLDLPAGEYRFSYILENGSRIPDPTILSSENDDFGGVNSVLRVKEAA
jgi:hypothetical protein